MSDNSLPGIEITVTASEPPEQVCCHVDQFEPNDDDDVEYTVYTFKGENVREMRSKILDQRENYIFTSGVVFDDIWEFHEDQHVFVEHVYTALCGNIDRLVRSDGSETVVGRVADDVVGEIAT